MLRSRNAGVTGTYRASQLAREYAADVQVPGNLPRWLLRRDVGIGLSAIALGVVTGALAPILDEDQLVNVALLYLLLTLVGAGVWGYVAGLTAAVLANVLLNFFFVPPLHTFTVQRPENVVALFVFLAVAAVGASMLALLRRQVARAVARQTEASILLQVNHAIAHASTPRDALERLCVTMAHALHAEGCAILRARGGWEVAGGTPDAADSARPTAAEVAAATEALTDGVVTTLPDSARTFVPFPATTGERGVLRIIGRIQTPALVQREQLLHAFAAEASVALHRADLAEEAQRAEALERADEFKTALLSSVSHDLRSPLTAIKAAVGSLRDADIEWSPEDTEGFLETIEAQTDRLTAVVTDLLEISRLEGGATRSHVEPVQVALLLADVVQATSAATEGRRVTVDARPTLWVRADYGLMMQALGNLVENAARYSVPRGTIHLTAGRDGADGIAIAVVDEGPGIPDEDLPHVFEKFYRGVQARRSRGTGLGLAIVKAMVELCGGTIVVQSSLRGTVFTIVLPAAEASS